jgi:hypothetical protein
MSNINGRTTGERRPTVVSIVSEMEGSQQGRGSCPPGGPEPPRISELTTET